MVKGNLLVVAFFGGSFDPPHQGHQKIVAKVIESLDIDLVLVVPAYQNPLKHTPFASATKRLQWCEKVFGGDKVSVLSYEIDHHILYTAHTLKQLEGLYDVRYLIVGADNIQTLGLWRDFEWLNKHITWVIVTRDNIPIDTSFLNSWVILPIEDSTSSTDIRTTRKTEQVDQQIALEVQTILNKGNRQYMKDTKNIDQRVEAIVKVLDEKKAEEIEVFNLDNADYIAKKVVIANSLGGKHTLALFDHLKTELKPQGEEFLNSDVSDEWVVADLGDILIHIMIPQYRQRYSLEEFLSEIAKRNS